MNIKEILTNLGIQLPDDKVMALGEELRNHLSPEDAAALREQLTQANTRLTEANGEIERFKTLDVDSIQKAADNWKEKAEEAERNANTRIAELEFAAALKDNLGGVKFTSEFARQGVVSEITGKGLKLENGKILGFEDALSTLRTSHPDAFAQETPAPPPMYAGSGTGSAPTPADTLKAVLGIKESR